VRQLTDYAIPDAHWKVFDGNCNLRWEICILKAWYLKKNTVPYVPANLLHFEYTHTDVHGNTTRGASGMGKNHVEIIPTSEAHNAYASVYLVPKGHVTQPPTVLCLTVTQKCTASVQHILGLGIFDNVCF
jgi:hypothetical protein